MLMWFFNYYDFILIFLTASAKNLSYLLFTHFYGLLMKFLNLTVIFYFNINVDFKILRFYTNFSNWLRQKS
jgi:hypothetical protein